MKNELKTCPFCGRSPTVRDMTHGSSIVDIEHEDWFNPPDNLVSHAD